MKQKTGIEIFFDLGGNGTLGNEVPVFQFPVWQYQALPLDINIVRDTITVTGSAPS